jgi:hypothetical protein
MKTTCPRLFAYHCQEVRICELRLFGVLGGLHWASGGGTLLVVERVRARLRDSKAGQKGGKALYVAVRRYEGVTDSQKVAQVAREGFVPIISEMPGFVAYYLVDAGDGVTVSTSIFEHKDAEEQSNFRAGEFVQEHLAPLLPNPPQITAGELVAYKAG